MASENGSPAGESTERSFAPRGRLPLSGVRVLELSHIVAGPSGGLLCADLGADVIKVEEPRIGDQSRASPNRGSTFYSLNRNKRSLAVDLKTDEGREIFSRLVKTADVVLDNYAPGVLERLGLGYEWAAQLNPRIIYCSIKGFLPGKYGDRPLLDELAQMMGGLAYMTGPVGQPLRAGASVIDIGAATYGVLATLAALYDRERTGRGQRIQSGLFETTVFLASQHVATASLTGRPPQPMPSRGMGTRLGWGVYQLFTTKDDRQVFIAITSNGHFKRFCEEFGLQDLGNDPALGSNAKRAANKERVLPRIAEVARSVTAAELMERLDRVKVPYSPLNTPLDVLDDPHLTGGHRLLEVQAADGPPVRAPAVPVDSSAFQVGVHHQPPGHGGDTRQILAEVGYSPAEVEDLVARKLVTADGPSLHTPDL